MNCWASVSACCARRTDQRVKAATDRALGLGANIERAADILQSACLVLRVIASNPLDDPAQKAAIRATLKEEAAVLRELASVLRSIGGDLP